jgi:hypothetical protein
MDLKVTGCEDVDWIHLAQDRDQRRALVSTVMEPISGCGRQQSKHAGLFHFKNQWNTVSVQNIQDSRPVSKNGRIKIYKPDLACSFVWV